MHVVGSSLTFAELEELHSMQAQFIPDITQTCCQDGINRCRVCKYLHAFSAVADRLMTAEVPVWWVKLTATATTTACPASQAHQPGLCCIGQPFFFALTPAPPGLLITDCPFIIFMPVKARPRCSGMVVLTVTYLPPTRQQSPKAEVRCAMLCAMRCNCESLAGLKCSSMSTDRAFRQAYKGPQKKPRDFFVKKA